MSTPEFQLPAHRFPDCILIEPDPAKIIRTKLPTEKQQLLVTRTNLVRGHTQVDIQTALTEIVQRIGQSDMVIKARRISLINSKNCINT